MPSLKTIVTYLLIPLLGINLAGLAVAALWLVSLGQWQVIWIGFMMLLFSSSIIPILLIPAGVFSHFMGLHATAKKPGKEKLMFVLSLVYLVLFLTFWCTGIFQYVIHSVAVQAFYPGLLWAATAALVPLLWWSSRDKKNILIMIMVEVTQIAMLALCASHMFRGDSPYWLSTCIFGGFIACITAAQAVYEEKFAKKLAAEAR